MDVVSFWLVITSLLLFAGYAFLIAYYNRGWRMTPIFVPGESTEFTIRVAVIIPARNEEKQIGKCLESIVNQSYPSHLLEIIVIDDHSTDGTAAVVRGFDHTNLKLLDLSAYIDKEINSYKKKAIDIAIRESNADWIITTDADVLLPERWVESMITYQKITGAEMIAGPVKLLSDRKLIHVFQSLDFLMLQGITAGALTRGLHVMGNGANLGYSKNAFLKVNGFAGIDEIATGDDMLLMEKIKRSFPGKVFYLKSETAIATALPAQSWGEFWNQRIRWASKAGKYEDKRLFLILLVVYLFNFSLFIMFVLSFWKQDMFLMVLVLFLCKTMIEFPFVNQVATFFQEKKNLKYFLIMQPLHIFYTVIAGFLGKFGKYKWKGRMVK